MEPPVIKRVIGAVFIKTARETTMFYVYELPKETSDQAIMVADSSVDVAGSSGDFSQRAKYDEADVDFVDDSLLNTAPHNAIEHQLLRGDVVGLALMSGAIIWSAMGAFG